MLLYNNKKIANILIIFIILLNFCFTITITNATSTTNNATGLSNTINKAQQQVKNDASIYKYKDSTNIGNTIALIIQTILSFIGIIFLAMIIIYGLQWMTANGDEEKIMKAKEGIKNAAIGIVIVFSAYIITRATIYIAKPIDNF